MLLLVRRFSLLALFLTLLTLAAIPPTHAATQELVENGGFESGDNGDWALSGAVITSGGNQYAGNYYAVLGEINGQTDLLSQVMQIPTNAGQATASFYYYIYTEETGGTAYDTLTVTLEDLTTGQSYPIASLSNNDGNTCTSGSSCYKYAGAQIDFSGLDGHNVQIRFQSTLDASVFTSFKIDNVSLLVNVEEVQQGAAPTAVTTSASSITQTSVTLRGTVNPNGLESQAFFNWRIPGQAANPTVPFQEIGAGTNPVSVSETISGLTADTLYEYQIYGINSINADAGAWVQFRTGANTTPSYECSDGIDNDGDGDVDYPNDSGCSSTTDNSEYAAPPQCSDGLDNDNDGQIDYPNDQDCSSADDTNETGFSAGGTDLLIANKTYSNGSSDPDIEWPLSDLHTQRFTNESNVVPGDWGISSVTVRAATVDAYLCMYLTQTSDDENGLTQAESELGDGSENGELDSAVEFMVWADDGNGTLEEDETIVTMNVFESVGVASANEDMFSLVDSTKGVWGESVVPAEAERSLGMAWCYGSLTLNPNPAGTGGNLGAPGYSCDSSGVDNSALTDSFTYSVEFFATQSRNNFSFTCANASSFGFSDTEISTENTFTAAPFSDGEASTGNDVTPETEGCTDETATNYDYEATIDDDTCEYENTPPTVTLLGEEIITLTQGETWSDPGATGWDEEDGILPVSIIGDTITDQSAPGQYILFYRVVDSSEATDTASRIVVVTDPESDFRSYVPEQSKNSCGNSLSPLTLTPEPSRSLVVIVHGWNANADGWVEDLRRDIWSQVDREATYVHSFDWRAAANTPVPQLAYQNAAEQGGVCLANEIRRYNPSHVHLIAHSAGSNVIQSAVESLADSIPVADAPTFHLTFLDAYTPYGDAERYGDAGAFRDITYAEHYVDVRDLVDLRESEFDLVAALLDTTDSWFGNTVNFNITELDPDLNRFLLESPADYAMRVHNWPTNQYRESIWQPEIKFGFPFAVESGTTINLQQRRLDGVWCDVTNLSEPYANCRQSTGAKIVAFKKDFDDALEENLTELGDEVVDLALSAHDMAVIFGNSTIDLGNATIDFWSTAASGAARLAMSGAVSTAQWAVENNLTTSSFWLLTGSPSWISFELSVTEPVNILSFDYVFPETAHEGQFAVFVNEQLVFTRNGAISQPNELSHAEIALPKRLEEGSHTITFRLDPGREDKQEEVYFMNVSLGALLVERSSEPALLDSTPPETSLLLSGEEVSHQIYRGQVEVSLASNDGESGVGVAITEYSIGIDDWMPYNEPISLSEEGLFTVFYQAADMAGNVEEAKSVTFEIVTTRGLIEGVYETVRESGPKQLEQMLMNALRDKSWNGREVDLARGRSVLSHTENAIRFAEKEGMTEAAERLTLAHTLMLESDRKVPKRSDR